MASHRDANRGRNPQRAGSLPEELASTNQPRTVLMSTDLVSSIERGTARRLRSPILLRISTLCWRSCGLPL